MKKVGMIGGLGWESTLNYYRLLNSLIEGKMGNFHSPTIILYSFDFYPILQMQMNGQWDQVLDNMASASKSLEASGADILVICSNTMHKIADRLQERTNLPLVSVIDCVAKKVLEDDKARIALLGTKFTMDDGFYSSRLFEMHGIESVVPEKDDMDVIQNIIYKELARGLVKRESKEAIMGIVKKLKSKGIQGIVLGCTELPMIIKKEDVDIPLYDTLKIHMDTVASMCLE